MRAAVAVRIDEKDPLSALELKDGWPEPEPGPDQVRIKVAATTVNMHDLWTLRGVGVNAEAFPKILGCDIVGWDPAGQRGDGHRRVRRSRRGRRRRDVRSEAFADLGGRCRARSASTRSCRRAT